MKAEGEVERVQESSVVANVEPAFGLGLGGVLDQLGVMDEGVLYGVDETAVGQYRDGNFEGK